ncbi:SRPBCC family protein [Amycolatopsis sp. NPDC058986]|uniref:SRPBCC family protein n=1 Tax=unclassified Amycolatopsis TaxID=2618356 RepID=UPI00366DF5A4
MTWTRTSTRTLPADPAALWDVLADIASWPRWDPDLARVVLHGPLTAGSTGFFHPTGRIRGRGHSLLADDFTVTACTPGSEIAVRQPIPLGHMDLAFTLAADGGGNTEFTQYITLHGPLRTVMVWIIAGDIVRNFDRKCSALLGLATAQAGHHTQ